MTDLARLTALAEAVKALLEHTGGHAASCESLIRLGAECDCQLHAALAALGKEDA